MLLRRKELQWWNSKHRNSMTSRIYRSQIQNSLYFPLITSPSMNYCRKDSLLPSPFMLIIVDKHRCMDHEPCNVTIPLAGYLQEFKSYRQDVMLIVTTDRSALVFSSVLQLISPIVPSLPSLV